MKKTTDPLEALIVNAGSADPAISQRKAEIHAALDQAIKDEDVEAIKTSTRDLEHLLEHEGPRESRVALTGDELERHYAEQADAHKLGLLAQIERGLRATDQHLIEAHEHGQPIPEPIAAHRKKLRDLADAVAAATTHAELAAIAIPEPPA